MNPVVEFEGPDNSELDKAESFVQETSLSKSERFIFKEQKAHKTFVGSIGETMIQGLLPLNHKTSAEMDDIRNYDFLVGNLKIEVKTTERRYVPKPEWDNKMFLDDSDKNFDVVVFVSVIVPVRGDIRRFFCGWLTKQEFIDKSKHFDKGEYDPTNQITMRAESWNVRISECRPLEEFLRLIKGVN